MERVKPEVWLKTNYRAHLLLASLPASAVIGGALLVLMAQSRIWFGVSAGVLIAAVAWLLLSLSRARLPRLAYRDGKLLVYLRGVRPIEMPIDVVECFFLGQGASLLPRSLEGKAGEAAEASTVVVRLAEAAKEWSHLDVRPSLGQWCESYITIRGTWCEPLSGDVVASLNQRLVAAHRAQKRARETVPA